jgi:AAA15 family ATPase/GTPase
MRIQEFSFGNFRSFKDIQTLNLSTAKIKSKYSEIDTNNVIQGDNNDNISFLKSKAIYGANASGKSNIIKAFVSFIRIIKTSVKDEKVLNYIDSFKLSTETEEEPSFFQIIFWHKEIKYRYGFEADDENIYAEWLYAKPNDRELPYFIRDNQEIIELDKTNYNEGNKLMSLLDDDSEENDIFRNNSLFLSTIATFGFGKLSKQLIDSLGSIFIVSGLGHQGMSRYAGEAIGDENKKKYILDFLKYGDIGIEDVNSIEVSSDDLPEDTNDDIKKVFDNKKKRKLLISTRKKYNENLESNDVELFSFGMHESEGTKKMFELSPFIYDALKENRPIIIDEFDARFHPLLTKKILELFNSKENTGSQLIFTTHDTNLLSSDLLRRDQIEFVEKDKYGASHLYSLVKFKGIRNTASFEKDYIQGKYGAIPFLGDFSKLINTDEDA